MSIDIDVIVDADAWSVLENLEDLSGKAIDAVLAETRHAVAPAAEVSLLFCDDSKIRELNKAWRGMDKPTNVLSFPAAEPDDVPKAPLLGDIVVAFETVQREAREEEKSFPDHVTHMVVHGFLHLLGYDHENDADAEKMESAEQRILAQLGIADPYAATVPVGDDDK
ncbi:MAG: rRNA maturation factor [Hyphomicrobiales bacterium]|nr:rRNA maturation factor [Hyphomicrobiales bacterium]